MKKVVLTNTDTVAVEQTRAANLYYAKILGGWYKLHRIQSGELTEAWAWISLHNSNCWANSTFPTMEKALLSVVGQEEMEVFEFVSVAEFARWFVKQF